MTTQHLDTITIDESTSLMLAPEFAVIRVVIDGESSVFGREALKKSKEVAKFTSELESIDYSKENISLDNISIQTSTGALLKSSQAKFTLTLDKVLLDIMPKVLSVISQQKNIEIQSVRYDFGDLGEKKSQLLRQACISAKQQGLEICTAFNVPMLSVHSMRPSWNHPGVQTMLQTRGKGDFFESGGNNELQGLDIAANYKSKLSVSLRIEFRVGAFE